MALEQKCSGGSVRVWLEFWDTEAGGCKAMTLTCILEFIISQIY